MTKTDKNKKKIIAIVFGDGNIGLLELITE